jgi:hypothetical protein
VVEADTLEGHAVDGIASVKQLEAEHGELPETLMAESPSGSQHRYFKWPAGVSIRNSASKIAPGVDVRGDGGMVIAPPSVKPGKGEYRWVNAHDIADAPEWPSSVRYGKLMKFGMTKFLNKRCAAQEDTVLDAIDAGLRGACNSRRRPRHTRAALPHSVYGADRDRRCCSDPRAAGLTCGVLLRPPVTRPVRVD